ncbi:UDP-glucose dehydrogenase family protein [Chengkuizengella sediminis]|uniref:UDP-glucose dehydrogenase family protein n=1 Tax=Chengkuizengella sediminis TaxID=1885917 RepID=UPI00138A59A2|nr:UDP-glucose/GDP-mannose dehydrogenase family protein [Chengkuizengella sediminis]NDI34865.1 UDP-glucose/GDP-mannose dehydrogenase family protein [Chengkuizengella sediminis]
MRISIVGTGYVGLVTGVCLANIGHNVLCIDVNEHKIKQLNRGVSPIFEPGLEELLQKNMHENRLSFTSDKKLGYGFGEVIFIAVGTPQNNDGSADLTYIKQVAEDIAKNIKKHTIVVTKSTVPVGTNNLIKKIIKNKVNHNIRFDIASNPEFLREGSAIEDTFNGDRIIIGTENKLTADVLERIFNPIQIPIYKTDIQSAELIKYASNAFLSTKISFINEISMLCDKVGANVENVADGMGLDHRIGREFLNAGIGYGGSCFPKDTKALVQIAEQYNHDFKLLKSVIEVNDQHQILMIEKTKERFGNLRNKKIAVLGLTFKPNTDDMREAASIIIIKELVREGALVSAYDPVAKSAKKLFPSEVNVSLTKEEALSNADAALIVTEWDEFKQIPLNQLHSLMKTPILFDGRNCFELDEVKQAGIEYYSIGRPSVHTILSDIANTI